MFNENILWTNYIWNHLNLLGNYKNSFISSKYYYYYQYKFHNELKWSLTSIRASPRRFYPVPSFPIPQILSKGEFSTRILSSVAKNFLRRSLFYENFMINPYFMISNFSFSKLSFIFNFLANLLQAKGSGVFLTYSWSSSLSILKAW